MYDPIQYVHYMLESCEEVSTYNLLEQMTVNPVIFLDIIN
jgi:hypothetical protein